MPKRLSADTRLEHLRKDAKRWLKALRAGNADARSRLESVSPGARADPGLRDVQQALAREYGQESWIALKSALQNLALDGETSGARAETILQSAWDGDLAAASRILVRDPSLARENLHLAAMCGDLDEVRRRLDRNPAAAAIKAGPRGGDPLLYLAYGRLPGAAERAVEIARLLIEAGSDPKAEFDDGWGNPFTVLTGVIGRGEGNRPGHPRADALAELLIESGVDPFDTQALYNTSIVEDDPHWLDVLYGHCERRGTTGRWLEVGRGLGGNVHQPTVGYLLGNAVNNGHPRRVAWLLDHGADPNGVNAYSGLPHLKAARLAGQTEVAELLLQRGANRVPLAGYEAFQMAALAGDRVTARQLAAENPGFLARPEALHVAAGRGLIEALELILDLGVDPNLPDPEGVCALHQAAGFGGAASVRLLVARGAEIDPRERRYGATPLGWAVHMRNADGIAELAPFSGDLPNLVQLARLDLIAALLDREPEALRAVDAKTGTTALFWLPEDEELAVQAAELLLSRGVDRGQVNLLGLKAEQVARKRGLDDAADLIAEWRNG